MKELRFSELMAVYEETNREIAQSEYPHEDPNVGIILAEQFAYQFLEECFFSTDGAFYALWMENERAVSALRMEPYKDGWLIEGLETAPEHRRKGYAKMLLREVLDNCKNEGKVPVYSHISKKNVASICTHEACGFQQVLDYAVEIDGSISKKAVTYQYY